MPDGLNSELTSVHTLIFDIGGTVFDWLSAVNARELDAVSPTHRPPGLDPNAFAVAVRAGFFELYGQVVRGERAG